MVLLFVELFHGLYCSGSMSKGPILDVDDGDDDYDDDNHKEYQ